MQQVRLEFPAWMRARSRLCAHSWTGRMCLSVYLPDLESQCASKVYHSFFIICIATQSQAAFEIDAFVRDCSSSAMIPYWILCLRWSLTGFLGPWWAFSTDFFVLDEPSALIPLSTMNNWTPLFTTSAIDPWSKQIVSRERFCNLIGAARNSTASTPQCCQALFSSRAEVGMEIGTGYEANS